MTHRNTTGFTLVELMLSMTFISVLLLSIAMLIMQITSIYNKGLTLRSVNEAGQIVSSDIERTLNTSTPTLVEQAPDPAVVNPTGGRFCIGTTIYAWNYGEFFGQAGLFNQYEDGRSEPVRLVKFADDGKDYCVAVSGTYPKLPNTATELLASGDSNLAIHDFTITHAPVEGDATQEMYNISFVLGTNDNGVIDANGCEAPVSNVDDEYCAVNTFVFTARAGNNEK